MKLIFFHDHIVTYNGNYLYSNGSINSKVIERYSSLFEEFTLASRVNNNRSINNLTFLLEIGKLKHLPIPSLSSLNYNNFAIASKKIETAVLENDFVIARLPSFIGYLGIHYAKKHNKKFSIEMAGCPFDSLWNYGGIKGKLIAPVMFFLTKYYVFNAKNLLYVTSFFLQKRYPSKTKNVLNCSNVEIEVDYSIIKRRELKIKEEKSTIVLGMIGSLSSKYKGFDIALKALKVLEDLYPKQYKLEIVGGGDSIKIKKLIKKLKLVDNVQLIGPLPHPHGIFNWLDSIDIYLHPSIVEGLPRSMIEAMSRGCPSIGTNVGGIPELISKDNLIPKKDYNKLASIIHSFRDKSLLTNNSNQCFETSKKYDKKILDKKRNDFYNQWIIANQKNTK